MRYLGLGGDLVDYADGWDLQHRLHAEVVSGAAPDTLLLLEHAPVYTAGKRTEPHERPLDGTPVVDVDRGGKITWHGPGQLVGYPLVRLPEAFGVVDYVRRLEQALIDALAELGLATGRVPGRSGVWLPADARGPAGAQDRRDRRPGGRRRDHARLRAERRPRPHRLRPDRALRHRRRRRHLDRRRARQLAGPDLAGVRARPAPGAPAHLRAVRAHARPRTPCRPEPVAAGPTYGLTVSVVR